MSKFRDKLWIWGQTAGTHHAIGWNLPGVNKMTPAEGCKYLGIPNCARVVMNNQPRPPYDNEVEQLAEVNKVIWSILGDSSSDQTDQEMGELDEVIRLAKKYTKIVGGILDDFFIPERMSAYTPDVLAAMRQRLHTEFSRPLDLYMVVYENVLRPDIVPYLEQCDVLTFWTWDSADLFRLEENFAKLQEVAPGKRYMMGLYMWNYGYGIPNTREQMQQQFDTYKKWILEKKIEGVIVCSNCIADVGIEAVEWTREWIESVADLEIPD